MFFVISNNGIVGLAKHIVGCKWDNMGYTHLLLEEYSFIYILNILQKIHQFFLNLYYYVKVHVKDFKTYVIFKSFEVYL
jgi:hypothetical protein